MSERPPWKCVGLAGRLLGHRFLNFIDRETEFCLRCGMPTGGWSTDE